MKGKPLTFKEYQRKSRVTAVYPDIGKNFVYPTLGIVGESGEVAEKIKKILRDKGGQINEKDKQELSKELGDILWYIANLATELHLKLDDIALGNLDKLVSRLKRGQLHGEGDNR